MSASLTATPGGGATPPPGGAPAPGASPPPGGPPGGATPPIGSSSATGPSQNLGATAQGNQMVSLLLKAIVMAMTKVPPGTPLYNALSKANLDIGKELDPGAASPAGENNAMKTMALQRARMQPHLAAQATQVGSPGGAPGGAAPKPPTPPAA